MNKQLILASASPRRKELLQHHNIECKVVASDIEEILDSSVSIEKAIEQIAYDKAISVVKKYPNHLILAADTIVVCDQQILGKPKDEKDAFRMLRLLSSNTHQVITGVSILNKNEAIAFSEATTIIFRALSDEEINDYIIISKEPFDKAGAYAIQGRASVFVEKIVGDYDNVVGLPITRVIKELKKIW